MGKVRDIFNMNKLRTDKDYFILMVVFIISLLGQCIQSLGFKNFSEEGWKEWVLIGVFSFFLMYVLCCKKQFTEKKKKGEHLFFFNRVKVKSDMTYQTLLIIFLISLYGISLRSLRYNGIPFNVRTWKSIEPMLITSAFLLYVIYHIKKNNYKSE